VIDLAELAPSSRPELAGGHGERPYYDGVVFRAWLGDDPLSIGGGGRYDGLFRCSARRCRRWVLAGGDGWPAAREERSGGDAPPLHPERTTIRTPARPPVASCVPTTRPPPRTSRAATSPPPLPLRRGSSPVWTRRRLWQLFRAGARDRVPRTVICSLAEHGIGPPARRQKTCWRAGLGAAAAAPARGSAPAEALVRLAGAAARRQRRGWRAVPGRRGAAGPSVGGGDLPPRGLGELALLLQLADLALDVVQMARRCARTASPSCRCGGGVAPCLVASAAARQRFRARIGSG
jgi:hypothetical protein